MNNKKSWCFKSSTFSTPFPLKHSQVVNIQNEKFIINCSYLHVQAKEWIKPNQQKQQQP